MDDQYNGDTAINNHYFYKALPEALQPSMSCDNRSTSVFCNKKQDGYSLPHHNPLISGEIDDCTKKTRKYVGNRSFLHDTPHWRIGAMWNWKVDLSGRFKVLLGYLSVVTLLVLSTITLIVYLRSEVNEVKLELQLQKRENIILRELVDEQIKKLSALDRWFSKVNNELPLAERMTQEDVVLLKNNRKTTEGQNRIFVSQNHSGNIMQDSSKNDQYNLISFEETYSEKFPEDYAENSRIMLVNEDEDFEENSEELDSESEVVLRMKRDSGRGPTAVHFLNKVEDFFTSSDGIVKYWTPAKHFIKDSSAFTGYTFEDNNSKLTIKESGLYMIYVQVHYEAEELEFNQYEIHVQNKRGYDTHRIAQCSSVGPKAVGSFDNSCYTSVVYSLQENDVVFIQTNEINHKIAAREGQTFFGLIQLSAFPGEKKRKRRSKKIRNVKRVQKKKI